MNTIHRRYACFLIACPLLVLMLLIGCGRAPQSQSQTSQESQAQNAPADPSDSPQAPAKNFAFVTDSLEESPAGEPVSEISIARPQRVMLRLYNPQVGRQYEATWRLYDGSGRQIATNAFRFTPDETPWTPWYVFEPDYKLHKPGKWKWTVDVPGLGRYSTEVGVLPATPTELANLALHEKARESVFRAFAYYWQGYGNDFFTMIPEFGKHKIAQGNLPAKKPEEKTLLDISMELAQAVGDDPKKVLQKSRPRNIDAYVNYYLLLDVRALTMSFDRDSMSDADKLNGITYRGSAKFGFRLYRFFVPGTGWNDWQDVNAMPNEFFEAFARLAGLSEVPSELKEKLAVEFTVTQRDSNWFVTANNGDRFANGKLVSQGQPLNLAPSVAYAQRTVKTGTNPDRDADQNMGKLARDDPEAVERGVINTMTQLRGRPLQ